MSSKRRLRRKSCGHKQKHPTQARAVAHLLSLQAHDRQPVRMRTYKCSFCGHWHVGRCRQRR